MANRIKGEVALSHDGATFTLVLDFNALAEFEAATGQNAIKVLGGGDLTITQLRALMHAGLRRHHPEMTLEGAGEILQANMDKLGSALASAFPDAGGNGQAAGKPRR